MKKTSQERVALKVTKEELTEIEEGSKHEQIFKRTAYFVRKLVKPRFSQIRFFAGRGHATKEVNVPVRIVDDRPGGTIKIQIGEEQTSSKAQAEAAAPRESVHDRNVLDREIQQKGKGGCDGCSSDEKEKQVGKCQVPMCCSKKPVMATCQECNLDMCLPCWECVDDMRICICTRCFEKSVALNPDESGDSS